MTSNCPSLLPRSGRWPAALLLGFVLAAPAAAQTIVRYGEPARRGTIASALETHRYLLSCAAGDALRITFSSQNSGWPDYYYFHQLEVFQGTTRVGPSVQGLGVYTFQLTGAGYYTIEVRARNGQSTGWYAFQLDRLNDPVTAERIAFDWNMEGSIGATAGFAVYTLRASAAGSGTLRLACQDSGWPDYYHFHYAELVDTTGARLAVATGNASTPVSFRADGVYTLFVAARNQQSIGWYAVGVDCRSWPMTPCDCVAHSSSYGSGLAGTRGIPSLAAGSAPRLGSTVTIDLGNSYGQPTAAFLLLGLGADRAPAAGGTLLVSHPVVLEVNPLGVAGAQRAFPIPDDPLLCGIGVALQSAVADPGAPQGVALSRGLLVLLGR